MAIRWEARSASTSLCLQRKRETVVLPASFSKSSLLTADTVELLHVCLSHCI